MDAEWKKLARVTVEVDPDLIDLIPDFLTRKRADLQTMRISLESGDLATIAAVGHKIKGEGGSFGFDTMSEIGAELEASGKKGDRDSARQLVSDLSEYQAKTGNVLPRIVCVCDEYADLLVDRAATREVEAGNRNRAGIRQIAGCPPCAGQPDPTTGG